MRNGLFYLNNTGSRWVIFVDGKKIKHTWMTKSGNIVIRTPVYFEAFGNFGSACINYKGKRISVLNESILED